MMLSPFTLTSRSPAEQGEKTVSPQVKWGGGGTRLSLRSLTAGFEHNQGFCQGQSQVLCGKGSRGDPKTSLTHGDPDAALSIPGQGQETRAPAVSGSREKGGKKKKGIQEKEKKQARRPLAEEAGNCTHPVRSLEPSPAPRARPPHVPPLTGAQPSLVCRPVLPHILHKDGVHGLQAAPGGTCSPGTERQGATGTAGSIPRQKARLAPSW